MDSIASRNIFIFNVSTGALLGGVRQNRPLTEANSLFMLSRVLPITAFPFKSYREHQVG